MNGKVLLALMVMITAPALAADKDVLVERVGNTGFVQVDADSFNDLTPREKQLAYWLTRASIAIDPIVYDQLSRFGLQQKRILEMIVAHPPGIDPTVHKKITDFTKLFWASHGNHNGVTAQKFLPDFTFEEFVAAARIAAGGGDASEKVEQTLLDLRPSLFDPDFEPQLTAKSPRRGLDIIQASANNFYGRNVTLADLENFKEKHPLNSRVVKDEKGELVEEVYRVGGKYSKYLSEAIKYLRKARPFTEAGQGPVIDALIRYFQTGEFSDWLKFGALWVRNNPRVDFANGFIEVYRDARGAKATAQSFVSVTDEKLNDMMELIAENAQYFENHAPWADQYKKQDVKPPLAKAIETVIETADFSVGVTGDNLPNENEIHQKYGTKSFFFTGSSRTLTKARGDAPIDEFSYDDEERRLSRQHGQQADDLLTALHEVIGHGSGKLSPRLTGDATTYLKEYYSTLEEGRADLMALWNVWDPKLRELGLVKSDDVAKAMYHGAARAPLVQLRAIPKGDTIEEDHQRDRQLIVEYIMDRVPGSIERVQRDGRTFMHVIDFQKMRQGVGMLLAEIMRIKAEGDYAAAKAMVDRYGVRFDPKIRDEVVERYKKLNLPAYWSGINAELTKNGTKVMMSYPRDIVKQRLGYAAMYR
ncbi:MAG TPA: peptidase M49 [Thermoanaerobaculia bacterium]